MSSTPRPISPDILRPCIRLMSEVAIHSGSINDKKRLLMDGLSGIFDAKVWFWLLHVDLFLEGEPKVLGVLDGGVWDELRQLFNQQSSDLENLDPAFTYIKSLPASTQKQILVKRRSDIISDEDWYNSSHFKKYRQPMSMDHIMFAMYPLNDRITSIVGLNKESGKPDFSESEMDMLNILFTEIDWIHQEDIPADHGKELIHLTPRQREAFLHLSIGKSRSEIAEAMKLSIHTVNEYVKLIFEKYGVRSQPQLIAKVYRGG